MSLIEKLKKLSTVKETATLVDSKFFQKKDLVPTKIPVMNLLQSGEIDGGFGSGVTLWAGPSRHFKTSLMLVNMKAYLDKYKDAVVIFYDSEFGSPQSYFTSFGIPLDRVLHTPITNIEQLKFDLMKQLEGIERGERVFIAIDSIGNLASKKEVDDALDGKSVADMTRAKAFKSLFRMITPILTLKDLPLHAVAHTYDCGTADMVVRMADGTTKNLDKIKIGDKVKTPFGDEEVTYCVEYDDTFVTEIVLENGETLEFTDGHRFIVDGEWKYVADLRPGDEIQTYDIVNMGNNMGWIDELQQYLLQANREEESEPTA